MPQIQRRNQFAHKKRSMKPFWLCFAIIIGLAAVLILLEATNTTHLLHHNSSKTVNSPTAQATKGEPTNSSKNAPSQTNTGAPSTDTKNPTGTGGASTATLNAPTGDFISNHHPNLSGSPAPNTVQSVCNTTSGATCQITFTKDGVTKSLPAQTTDAGGATYWTWKLQDVGLTAGSWQVQAKATLGSQTKTANDAMALEVSE